MLNSTQLLEKSIEDEECNTNQKGCDSNSDSITTRITITKLTLFFDISVVSS